MGVETPAVYTVLAGLVMLASLLVRVLVKSDSRWERIIATQTDQMTELETQRDYYKALWEECVRNCRDHQ